MKSAAKKSTKTGTGVQTRRLKHPGGSDEHLSSKKVKAAFQRRKSFSTTDIMREFGAAKDNATAVAAVLRARNLIEKAGEAPDGSTLWKWV